MTTYTSPLTIKLPYGEAASFAEMQAYGTVLQSFIYDQEEKLTDIEDAKRHDETIDYLQSLASSYNEQLRVFKQTEARHQRKLMIALMQVVET